MNITDKQLYDLIIGLEKYKENGVVDPWILGDGTLIEPLDVLKELRELRISLEANRLIAQDKAND